MISDLIKKAPLKYLFFLLIIELLFLGYSVNSYCQNYENKKIMELSAANFSNRVGNLQDGSFYVDSSYFTDEAGNIIPTSTQTFTYGPYVKVGKGSYAVTLYYQAEEDGNSCYAHSNTATSNQLQSSYRIPLPKEQNSVTFHFLLTQGIEDLEIITEYCGSGSLCVDKMILTKTSASHMRNIFTTLAGCFFFLLLYYFFVSDSKVRTTLLCLTLITAASCYPLFTDYLTTGHDLPFHLTRIEGIAQGLHQGVFPVKIHPFWANDYGYAVGVFYGDAFLYLPALLRFLGLSLLESYKVYVVAINLATVLLSWKSFEKIFRSNHLALVASFLYTLAPYRLSNMYLRGSVGEYTALAFLPVVLCGFYLILTENHMQKGYWKNFLLPALGLTGIIQCHVISCEMVGIFILITCLLTINKVCNLRVFLTLCLTAFTTILLNLGFLIPFLSYFGGDFVMNSPDWFHTPIQGDGAYIAQLFSLFRNGYGSSSPSANGMAGEMPIGVGFTLFLGLLLFCYIRFCTVQTTEKGILYRFANLSALLGVLALYMSTCIFPWNSLANLSELFTTLVYNLQFPWRFLTLATLFLVIVTCLALQFAKKYFSKEIFIGIFSIMMCFFVTSTSWFFYDVLNRNIAYRPFETTDLNSMLLGSEEYLPTGTVLVQLTSKLPIPGEGVTVQHFEKKGTSIKLHITNLGASNYVELPLLYYDGYIAVSNALLTLTKGTNNVIRLEVPAQFDGDVSVYFNEPLSWRIGELISVITALGIIIGLSTTAHRKPKERYNHSED